MTPIKFPGVNVTYAEDQPEYQPLPAMKFPNGETIQCWELTDSELKVIQETKCVYVSQFTFNQPLQPILLTFTPDVIYPNEYEPCTFESLKEGDVVLLFNKQFQGKDSFAHCVIRSKRDDLLFIEVRDEVMVSFGSSLQCKEVPVVMIMAKVREV